MENFPFNGQPSYAQQSIDFNNPSFRNPNFDCSIKQLLSPVSFNAQLPLLPEHIPLNTLPDTAQPVMLNEPAPFPDTFPFSDTTFMDNSFDPSRSSSTGSASSVVDIKSEDGENEFTEVIGSMIPNGNTLAVSTLDQQFINPQVSSAFGAPFLSIPQSLTPVTSPLLQSNPAFPYLYYHFIKNTARVLVPHDDPQQNPFRTILAQMALHPSAQHLLAALLASSAAHRAGMKGEQPPKYLITNLLQTTLEGLRKALADPEEANQDTTLATAIALSSYNIISSDVQHWRMHLDGARELILHRRRIATTPLREDRRRSFLFKWFAYLDVIAGASGLTLKEHNYDSAVSLIEDVTDTPRSPTWEPSTFDTFTGFTERLLPMLLRIGKLAHEKRVAERNFIDITQDPAFEAHLQTLETDLITAELDNDAIVFPPNTRASLEHQLRACNEAFHAAARLHLQRRLRNMTSDEVRPIVEQVLKAIDQVPMGSEPEISLLYPLFSAGVEARGEWRQFALERMISMEKIGIGNVQRAKKVMLETWAQSDLNGFSDVRWEDVMEGMGWDLSLA